MKARHPAPPSPHNRFQEDANATTLQLGEDFQQVHCLFNSEVNILLQRALQERHSPLPAAFHQALEYTNRISKFQHQDVAEHVRRLLSETKDKRKLEEFEIAQLANLCPETSEEAKTLIPSLSNPPQSALQKQNSSGMDDDTLQTLLDQLVEAKRFQS
jgi:DNA-directed RNA polymerase II subunit RPB4